MKEFVIGFVLIVAGILLTPLLTPYFSKVDCDYILSEQIPTKFLDKDSLKESLQQITIRNNEDKALNNIKIIIKKKLLILI